MDTKRLVPQHQRRPNERSQKYNNTMGTQKLCGWCCVSDLALIIIILIIEKPLLSLFRMLSICLSINVYLWSPLNAICGDPPHPAQTCCCLGGGVEAFTCLGPRGERTKDQRREGVLRATIPLVVVVVVVGSGENSPDGGLR